MMKKLYVIGLLVCLCFSTKSEAQYFFGTTGLLHAPTADMQRDKTFLAGGGHLNKWATSSRFRNNYVHYTWNYYINITLFPWMEVGYTCTLIHNGSATKGKFTNQDRAFNLRLRLWKEGWWREWTPQIVLGADDPTTHADHGGGNLTWGGEEGDNNNFFTRFYLAVTKHCQFIGVGNLGAHVSLMYGHAMYAPHYVRPAAGVNFQLALTQEKWWAKALNGLNMMAEYYPIKYYGESGEKETCGVNIGASYAVWRDNINLWCEQYDMDHFSWGVAFKLHLK